MNKALSLAIFAGGVLLLIFGFIEYDSTSSDLSRFFSDAPTDKSIWLLVGGTVAIILGGFSLSRGGKLT